MADASLLNVKGTLMQENLSASQNRCTEQEGSFQGACGCAYKQTHGVTQLLQVHGSFLRRGFGCSTCVV